jgi:hypothetical protein
MSGETRAKRPQRGDVFEVTLPGGRFGYMRLLGKVDGGFEDVFEVLDLGGDKTNDLKSFDLAPISYVFCSIAKVLLENTAFCIVSSTNAHNSIPGFRRPLPLGWIMPDGRVIGHLSDEDATVPLAEIVPASGVIERLATNWRPADERRTLVELVKQGLKLSPRPKVRTKILFPSRDKANGAMEALRAKGLSVDVHGKSLEVVAERDIKELQSSDWLKRHEEQIEAVCSEFDGEYEGNEIG